MRRARLATCWLVATAAFSAASLGAAAQPCTTPADCGHHARAAGAISLELRLAWRVVGPITLDAAGRLQFPEVGAEPGIYRFELRGKDSLALYIGETQNLRQRFNQYRLPGKGQTTNHRICTAIREALASGGSVVVSLGQDARLCAGAGCSKADLASANQRRLLEQLAIFSAVPEAHVLNGELRVRKGRWALQKFSLCS